MPSTQIVTPTPCSSPKLVRTGTELICKRKKKAANLCLVIQDTRIVNAARLTAWMEKHDLHGYVPYFQVTAPAIRLAEMMLGLDTRSSLHYCWAQFLAFIAHRANDRDTAASPVYAAILSELPQEPDKCHIAYDVIEAIGIDIYEIRTDYNAHDAVADPTNSYHPRYEK